MIVGVKSLAVALLCALSVGIPFATGALGAESLAKLSVAACLLLGALTSLAVGMMGYGGGLWRPGSDGVDLRSGKLVNAASGAGAVRELPGWLLRLMLGASFLAIAASVIGNHGVVRLREELGGARPPSGRCKPPETAAAEIEEEEPEAPPPPPVDQAGCALVRRAYQLGYAKSLGTCAPQQPAAAKPKPRKEAAPEEPCLRRHLDEPFLHYAWRRWTEAADWASEVRPVDGSREQATEMRTKLGYFRSLTASSGHALTSVPHAAHHLWIAMPDPEPAGLLARTLGADACEGRFADVPLWRRFAVGEESKLVQHALGQLLFSSRFGTTTACANYQIHWGAAADACDRLLADPEAFLRDHDGWDEVSGVLDRRRRQLELRALAQTLGRAHLPPAPPPATAVVSLSCLRVDGSLAKAEVTGKIAELAGQKLGVRQLRMPRISVDGDGPLEVVAQLAKLLAGAPAASAAALDELDGVAPLDAGLGGAEGSAAGQASGAVAAAPTDSSPPATPPSPAVAALTPQQRVELLDGRGFSLTRLEAIEGTDPFAGERWPLQRAELVEVYPFQRVLFEFIDGFRRSYHAQRGRL